jgi:hypothetical protein
MKQMHASVCIDLPSDEFDEAAAKLKVKPLWEAFLKALIDGAIVAETTLETIETMARPSAKLHGAKRGRPRKTPALVLQPPPGGEAA